MVSFDFKSKGKLSVFVGLSVIVAIIIIPAFGDPEVKPTSGGTIDVSFATDPATPTPGGQTNLNIAFINKSTHATQQHIDYKISVMEGSNQICGTSVLHTAEGSISFPCQFPDAATYQVVVEVDGILFQPIPPETATFTVNLGGGTAPATNSTGMVIPSWIKKTAGWWASGQVGDQDFVKGIQYMIQNGIMQIPAQSSQTPSSASSGIPSWVKKTAGWWASGQVGDQDFVKGIEWLISNNIIVLSQ